MIQILERDDVFIREARPIKYYFAFESSMYDIISRNMLDFFATVVDFNNLVGEPVNSFETEYKGLKYLRQLFFDKIENDPDLDKYVSLYKWLDAALDVVVLNLVPASADSSEEVNTVIENHILERNKYRQKLLYTDRTKETSAGFTKTNKVGKASNRPQEKEGAIVDKPNKRVASLDRNRVLYYNNKFYIDIAFGRGGGGSDR